MITNKKEAKAMSKHISCDCKCKFYTTTGNSNQKWNNSSWNPSTYICENDEYLKIISDDAKIVCDESISVMDIVPTKMTYTIATNVAKKMS